LSLHNKNTSKPWLSSGNINHERTSSANKRTKRTDEDNVQGDNWDKIGLNEMLKGNHRSLFDKKSRFQKIQILEANDLRMYLNGQLQFSSLDERIYHEAIVHPVFTAASSHERVLILGGGDGLALREVLKYKDVKHVDLVDLDAMVLDAAKHVQNLAALNHYSLHDLRVNVHPQDAVLFLKSLRAPYDVIIVDFPDPTGRIISDLYTTEFYSLLKSSLKTDGVFVCQSNSPEETPVVFWSIGKTIESAGFQTLSYHITVPSFGDWGFHIGSKTQKSLAGKKVPVSNRTLPANLKELTEFPLNVTAQKHRSIVNTKRNSKLHQIFQKESLYLG
jgi:spermidine synthase